VAVLLPHALFWFSSLLLRIENPYTQWVWIANPDQRHVAEHPRGRVGRNEHPRGRGILGSSLLVKDSISELFKGRQDDMSDTGQLELNFNC